MKDLETKINKMTKVELCRKLDNILQRMAKDQNRSIEPFRSTISSYVGLVDCQPFIEQCEKGEYPSLTAEDVLLLVSFCGVDSSKEDSELGEFDTTIFQHYGTGHFIALRTWFSLPHDEDDCDEDGFVYCYPVNVKQVKVWERAND